MRLAARTALVSTCLSVSIAAAVLVVAGCGSVTPTTTPGGPTASAVSTTPPSSAAPSQPTDASLIGIALPTKASPRWVMDGEIMVKALQDLGYETDLQYAQDDVKAQVSQVEAMIADGARALVIAPVDGARLVDVLQTAAEADVKVIAYDRLISDTPNVDYFTAFDSVRVGVLQAGSIVDALGVRGRGPFNIELFAGSPDDPAAEPAFTSAMTVLEPFLDDGRLVVRSGEIAFPAQVGTPRGDGASAQARMDNVLAAWYRDDRVDAVLSPSDAISGGILSSLKQAGYYPPGRPGPVVTGGGAEIASVKSILAGEQTSTILLDSRSLARQAATMADQVLRGRTVDVNDTRTFQNGARTVPTFLLDAILVTAGNAQAELIDSGYYAADQLK